MKALLLSLLTILGAATGLAGEEGDEKAYLGVRIDTTGILDKDDLQKVIITKVIEGSSAAKAGLKDQDIILDVNGTKVVNSNELIELISNYQPGEKVRVAVLRDGENQAYEVKLGGRKSPSERRWLYVFDSQGPWLGIDMMDLNEQLAKYFNVDNGVLVEEVQANSPAETAGLQAGDIITAINDQAVATTEDLTELIGELSEGDQVQISAVRKGKKKSLSATLASWEDNEHHVSRSSVFRLKPNTALKWEDSFPQSLERLQALQKLNSFRFRFDNDEVEKLREELKQLRKELNDMRNNQ